MVSDEKERKGGRPNMAPGSFSNITVKPRLDDEGKPTGQWQARGRVRTRRGETKQMARNHRTKEGARNALHDAMREEATKAGGAKVEGSSTFGKLAARYFDDLAAKDRAAGTLYNYRRRMETVLLPELANVKLEDITVVLLEDMFEEFRRADGKPYSAATLRGLRQPLSGVMDLAVRYGAVPRNPVKDMGKIEGKSPPAHALSEEEVDLLLDVARADQVAVDYDLPDFIEFMLGTGMRVSEALALTGEDVDLIGKQIHVRHNLIHLSSIAISDGKTAASRRSMHMSKEVEEVLFRRRQNDLELNVPPSAPVFWTVSYTEDEDGRKRRNGGPTYRSPHNLRRAMRRLYAHPEIGGRLDWVKQPTHVFRKTAATRLRHAGFSDFDIADFLGHEDVSTAQQSYVDRRRPSKAVAEALTRRRTPALEG